MLEDTTHRRTTSLGAMMTQKTRLPRPGLLQQTSEYRGMIIAGWWFGTFFFPYIGNFIIIPTDELIFFRGVGIPPTR